MARAELAVNIANLVKRYGSIAAIDGLTMEVRRGEIFGLVGPDGAGKTTTLRLACGILSPDGGEAVVAGFDVARETERVKERIGYMSQRFNLYGDLTVRENLDFFGDLLQVPLQERKQRTEELLAFSRLTEYQNRPADQLSGGMKQKLALACTLIHQPEVLFLDEPTTGIDPVSRRELWRILSRLLGQGVTILIATPYMDEAERCNTVGFIWQGRLIACDTPPRLKTLMPYQVLELRGADHRTIQQIARRVPGVEDVHLFGDSLHLAVSDAQSTVQRLTAELRKQNIEEHTLRSVQPSIEDVFIFLAQRGAGDKGAPV